MRVKQISKKLISVLLSLSVIASMLVMSSISVSAESTEEFSPSWNYTRNCSIKNLMVLLKIYKSLVCLKQVYFFILTI